MGCRLLISHWPVFFGFCHLVSCGLFLPEQPFLLLCLPPECYSEQLLLHLLSVVLLADAPSLCRWLHDASTLLDEKISGKTGTPSWWISRMIKET